MRTAPARLLLAALALALAVAAPARGADAKPVRASLVAVSPGFAPGQAATVALRLEHASGWHTYHRDPGDAGLPTSLAWSLPAGVEAGDIQWPKPEAFFDPSGLKGQGYTGTVELPVAIRVGSGYAGQALTLSAKASWLACAKVCIPGSAQLALTLPRAAAPAPAGGGASLGLMLLFAFVGGLVLNLMPCVLPVLSLKVMALVGHANEPPRRRAGRALAYAAGVMASFWALGAVVVALKNAGEAAGWGFQMQNPWFVAAMAALVTAFAMDLFGAFELTLPGAAGTVLARATGHGGLLGAFLSGAFATLLATPCTAPFLGSAVGFAFSQSAPRLALVFTAVGLGLALPFVAMALIPGAGRLLPKPGPWMEHLKHGMGFLLAAFVPWLLWVLGSQAGMAAAAACLGFLVALAFILWLAGLAAPVGCGRGRWALVWGLAALTAAAAWLGMVAPALRQAPGPAAAPRAHALGAPYSPQALEALRREGRVVVVDATAEWCWTCKVNERAVLGADRTRRALQAAGAVVLVADWTSQDPQVTALLRSFGRSGVPLTAVYPPKGEPELLGELLTFTMVEDALARASARR